MSGLDLTPVTVVRCLLDRNAKESESNSSGAVDVKVRMYMRSYERSFRLAEGGSHQLWATGVWARGSRP